MRPFHLERARGRHDAVIATFFSAFTGWLPQHGLHYKAELLPEQELFLHVPESYRRADIIPHLSMNLRVLGVRNAPPNFPRIQRIELLER